VVGGLSPLPLADFSASAGPFAGLMLIGFLIGIVGHATKSKTLVALGIALIFLATVIAPLVLFGNPY
jgi:hypothetical protein